MTVRRDELLSALGQLAGTDRVLIYDLPETEAPHRSTPTTPFVRGSDAWWRFVERRRVLDDGNGLNLVITLRGLRSDERLLVVAWGTAFANSFLLIEPADPWLDLTTKEGMAEFTKTSPPGPPQLWRGLPTPSGTTGSGTKRAISRAAARRSACNPTPPSGRQSPSVCHGPSLRRRSSLA